MSQFIETLAIKDGEIPLLDLHQGRLNRTFATHFSNHSPHDLFALIDAGQRNGTLKCRVLYDALTTNIEYLEYVLPKINSLKIVSKDDIDYTYKTSNRDGLIALYNQRENCDDILISKNGLVTDSYFANVALYDGKTWYTPDRPLLAGVRRQFLIQNKILTERVIKIEDLQGFKSISLINALLDLGEVVIPIGNIKH